MEHIGELMRTLGEQDRALAAHLTEQGIPSEGTEGLIALVEKVGKLNCFPILFYDWDGVTLLGIGKARKSDTLTEQQALIDEAMRDFALSQMSAEDGAAYQAAGFDPANGTAHPADGKPLSNKPGYTFGKWIPLDKEYGSSYGGAVRITSIYDIDTIPEPEGYVFTEADFENIVKVKAAYRTNADMEPALTTTTPINREPTITATGCMRFGTSTCYAITFTVERKSKTELLVPRARKLGLRIYKTIDAGNDTTVNIYDRMELVNRDKVEVMIAVDDKVKTMEVHVIDLCDDPELGGGSAWPTMTATLTYITVNAEGEAHDGYIALGNVAYINELLRTDAIDTLTATFLITAELNYNPAYGQTGTTAGRRLTAVRENLKAMYDSLPADKQAAGLTWDEMQEAIKKGTVWDTALNDGAGGWTNGFTGTYVPPETTATE